jgi:hypothetical protein
MQDIYIKNPNILNHKTEMLKLLKHDEMFVELPEEHHKGYYISNYGRLYSKKRKTGKLLAEGWGGYKNKPNRLKPQYFLPNKNGEYKNHKTSRLVASVFCQNLNPETKNEVHHKDRNNLNNRADNLMWVSRAEHCLLENNRKIYVYEPDKETMINFKTIQSMCDYLSVRKTQLNYIFYKNKNPKFTIDGIKIFEFGKQKTYIGIAG